MTAGIPDAEFEQLRQRAAARDTSMDWMWAFGATAPYKYFVQALAKREIARSVWREYFRTHDAFLLPTCFVPAFPHDHSLPLEKRTLATPEGTRNYQDLVFWIAIPTLTGCPATIAPVGLTAEGLPVGMQIMGPWLEDATPIDLAGRVGELMGGFRSPPGFGS